jgi:hypothetical protein
MATVNTTDPKPGFVYNADDDTWYPLAGIATQSLDGLTDVIITSPTSGQTVVYNGTNWVNTAETGDISGVTAGTGITGGGTSGAVTVSFDQANFGGGQFAAAKNKIINGDFNVNQRAFTSTTTSGLYGFDRWSTNFSGATATYSAQAFTLGAAPVAGYESKNFARLAVATGNDFCSIRQQIESVRTFAGQTMTVSFYAKGTNPTTENGLFLVVTQNFGTGGSPSTGVDLVSPKFELTANWTRYSFTFNVASISGKTLGTNGNDFLSIQFGQWTSASTDAWTLDLWGVQVEAGDFATPFQTATGTIQGELAACQRYYYRFNSSATYTNAPFAQGISTTATSARVYIQNPVTMRALPTSIDFANVAISDKTLYTLSVSALVISSATESMVDLTATNATGATVGRSAILMAFTSAAAFVGINAEL